jgi:hypothetical protein
MQRRGGFVAKSQQHATVADGHGQRLIARDTPAPARGNDQQDHGGIDKKNQALQRRADVLQPGKVQHAGQVVAGETQNGNADSIARLHWRLAASAPPGHRNEKRPGQRHAQGHRSQGVDAMAVEQLGHDGLS